MKKKISALVLIVAMTMTIAAIAHAESLVLHEAFTQVFFSPGGGCTNAIVKEIGQARQEILVQAYSFTSVPIARALTDAFRRGITVEVILDKSQRTEKYSSAAFLKNYGIPTYIDAQHPIAHNKILVIDRETVVTGSFNFTRQAESNAENIIILKDTNLAALYAANWFGHRDHSERYW